MRALDALDKFKAFTKEQGEKSSYSKGKAGTNNAPKFNGTELAQYLVQSIPVVINGTTVGLTMDKMGHVDWVALANSVNDKIPFTNGQQIDIMNQVYSAIYNDPNIQNVTSVVSLLREYLPQIANAKSPYEGYTPVFENLLEDEEEKRKRENEGGAIQIPLKPQTPSALDFTKPYDWAGNMPKPLEFKSDLERSVEKSGGIVTGTASYNKRYPDRFPHSNINHKNTNRTTNGHRNTPHVDDQTEYKNRYDRSAARPTQVIINIDKLANFDRTAIAGNSDERIIAEAIETKIAEAVAMLSSQALNSASGLIAQGV